MSWLALRAVRIYTVDWVSILLAVLGSGVLLYFATGRLLWESWSDFGLSLAATLLWIAPALIVALSVKSTSTSINVLEVIWFLTLVAAVVTVFLTPSVEHNLLQVFPYLIFTPFGIEGFVRRLRKQAT